MTVGDRQKKIFNEIKVLFPEVKPGMKLLDMYEEMIRAHKEALKGIRDRDRAVQKLIEYIEG